MAQPDYPYRQAAASSGPWNSSRSLFYTDPYQRGGSGSYEQPPARPTSVSYQQHPGAGSTYHLPSGIGHPVSSPAPISRPEPSPFHTPSTYPSSSRQSPIGYVPGGGAPGGGAPGGGAPGAAATTPTTSFGAVPYHSGASSQAQQWEYPGKYSPSDSLDDIIGSPNLSDHSMEGAGSGSLPSAKVKTPGKHRQQRRPSNRDEFDGPHQFLQRPPPEYIAMQERELPHLPTNLLAQEQDSVLSQVNDRLSQCSYDFVAKYQFPIPLSQDMRPVERPQDREWAEWVYLLKRLATKRRIPARVLYNGQIKQFVTVLENSLEMRHSSKQQSRPLKDDRNVLQLISAGIQVAKILKDASAMDYLDKLYVSTENQIHERSSAAAARFR